MGWQYFQYMSKFILTFLVIAPFSVISQINYDNAPWDINCDSSYTQSSMNLCSSKKTTIADSVMNDLYQKNLDLLNKEIESINQASESEYGLEEGYNLTAKRLIESQDKFIEYRKSVCDLEHSLWAGGTISPLMVNIRYLSITIERIKLLEKEFLLMIEK